MIWNQQRRKCCICLCPEQDIFTQVKADLDRTLPWNIHRYVAQSPSHVKLLTTPWTAAHQASLSLTVSQSLPKMPSSHLILCCPLFLLPSIFPSIRIPIFLLKWYCYDANKIYEKQLLSKVKSTAIFAGLNSYPRTNMNTKYVYLFLELVWFPSPLNTAVWTDAQ